MQKVFEVKGFQVIETVDGDIIISNDENGLHSKSIEEFTMSRKCDMYSRESITEYASVMTCVVNNWQHGIKAVSYTHLRAHETPEHLVCRLLLEKKK